MPSSLARRTTSRRANAGIHADDQLHAVGRRLFHRFASHAVAVAQAMRDDETTASPPAISIAFFKMTTEVVPSTS